MSAPLRALSIMQPWSWLIANGHKDIENRSWPTRFRGRIMIHAGKKFDGDDDAEEWDWPHIDRPKDFDMGGIVGECEIVDCVTSSKSRWFFGPYGFVIRNARPLPFQPCRGMLGFFVPDFTPPTVAAKTPEPKAAKAPAPKLIGDLFS
jgi:hypothetical protein